MPASRSARIPALLVILLFLLPAAGVFPVAGASHVSGAVSTYTLDADFDEGTMVNVDHFVPDQLQLEDEAETFPFIWIAVSSKGTVVKVHTVTGDVLGEYQTSPSGMAANPSRTTVDHLGNVWVTNRNEGSTLNGVPMGSVVHFALEENGQCVDRNGNGIIDTSAGLGDVRAWTNAGGVDTDGGVETAADECVIHFTRTHSTGNRHVSVTASNDVWVSGSSVKAFDLISGTTGAIIRSEASVNCGGYGGLIDPNGVIWSANPFLRWDTALPLTAGNYVCDTSFDSYGLCIDGQGNVWNTALSGGVIRKFSPSGVLLGTFGHGNPQAQGCVVDHNDDVWVAHSLICLCSTVGHLKNDGTYVGNVAVGNQPTGVAVDSAGKVWATNYQDGTASRIDPDAGPIGADGVTRVGAVDFTTVYLGGNLYNYSDMTGSTLGGRRNVGRWTIVHDTLVSDAQWGYVSWNASTPGDALLTVQVATSEDGVAFSAPVAASNGGLLSVPQGEFIRIVVTFKRASTGESPILYDVGLRIIPKTVGFEGLCVVGGAAEGVEARALSFDVVAGTTLPGGSVSILMLSGPAGLAFAPGASGNPTTGTATWASPVAGTHLATFEATDSGGSVTKCRLPIHIHLPRAQARAIAVWGGSAVPASLEYRSTSFDKRVEGNSDPMETQREAIVDFPGYVDAYAVEERAGATVGTGSAVSAAATKMAEVSLLEGLVVLKGLHQEASVDWDYGRSAQVLSIRSSIASVVVDGQEIDLPAPGAPVVIPLPGGGEMRLFERTQTDGPDAASIEEKLVHLYAPLAYGRHEIILGDVLVRAGLDVPFASQERRILPQDDARTGRDAGAGAAGATPIVRGAYDAMVEPGDAMDSYRFSVLHGEKIVFAAQPAPRLTAVGGYAEMGPYPVPALFLPGTDGPTTDEFVVRLYDPAGALRETSTALPPAARVELNADLSGEWRVDVTHAVQHKTNYSLALSLTPLVLLPQAEGGALADAPAACSPSNPAIPTIGNGAWTGVVRDGDVSDVFRVHARIGDVLSATLKPGEDADGVDMALILYDRACGLIQFSDLNVADLKGSPELVARLPSTYTGEYYLRVVRVNGVGNYVLTASVVDPMPTVGPTNDAFTGTDAPESRAAASPAPTPAFQGRIEEGDAGDVFLLPLVAGRYVNIVVETNALSDFTVAVTGPSGAPVTPTFVGLLGETHVWHYMPVAGNHAVHVSASMGGGGYTVAWSQSLSQA